MSNISQVIHEEIPRDYRTEIPNIILELIEAGEISMADYMLYSVYRRIAGQNGKCWIGTRGLAEKTGLSTPTITQSKKNLSRKFDALNGKSLIRITPCNRKKEMSDTVTIIDIWPENHEFFKKRLTCVKPRYTGVQNEDTGVCKMTLHKKEPFKKKPYKKKPSSSSRASSSDCSQLSDDDYSPSPDIPPVSSLIADSPIDDASGGDDDACGAFFSSLSKAKAKANKEGSSPPASLPPREESSDIVVNKTNGTKLVMTQSHIYRHFSKTLFPTEIVQEAIKRIRQPNGPINNILRYLESVCDSILKEQKYKKTFKKTEKPAKSYDEPRKEPEKPKPVETSPPAKKFTWADGMELIRKEKEAKKCSNNSNTEMNTKPPT